MTTGHPRVRRAARNGLQLRGSPTMRLFLDGARVEEIRHALDLWDVDGLTTNPRHVLASGKPLRRVLREIADLVDGTDKPVSVEIDPRLTRWQDMVEQGED